MQNMRKFTLGKSSDLQIRAEIFTVKSQLTIPNSIGIWSVVIWKLKVKSMWHLYIMNLTLKRFYILPKLKFNFKCNVTFYDM